MILDLVKRNEQHCTFGQMTLEQNQFQDFGWKEMAQVVEQTKSLVKVEFLSNELTPEGGF